MTAHKLISRSVTTSGLSSAITKNMYLPSRSAVCYN